MLYTDEAIKRRKRKMSKIKKVLIAVVYITLLPLFVYNISLIAQAIINPNKTPSFLGIKTYVIISGSMMPELEIGDIVVVKEVQEKELQKGDIISFRQGHNVVTHRISEIIVTDNKVQYKTKGDNNNIEDIEAISKDEIEGKVINKIPAIGNIVLLLKNKTLIIVIVIFYYIYLLNDQSTQKIKNIRKIKREEYEAKKSKEKDNGEERT